MHITNGFLKSWVVIFLFVPGIFFWQGILAEAMETSASDHRIILLHVPLIPHTVATFNIAQRGKLLLFGSPKEFYWGSTLRTVSLLKTLAMKKDELDAMARQFSEIAQSTVLTTAMQNDLMLKKTEENVATIRAMGIDIEGFRTAPSALFNPYVNPAELNKSPESYIHGPIYDIESHQTYTKRLNKAFNNLFSYSPKIAFVQEIELGKEQQPFNQIVKRYSQYGVIKPTSINMNETTAAVVTFYDKASYYIVKEGSDIRNDINTIFSLLFDIKNDTKLLVATLKSKATGRLIFTVNIHVPYKSANRSEESYEIIRQLLHDIPNVVIGGDFNVRSENKDWLTKKFSLQEHIYSTFDLTPETVDFGNPTFDMLLVSAVPINVPINYGKILKELVDKSKEVAEKRKNENKGIGG